MAKSEELKGQIKQINETQAELEAQIQVLAGQLAAKNALIMEAGGESYKKLRDQLAKYEREVAD